MQQLSLTSTDERTIDSLLTFVRALRLGKADLSEIRPWWEWFYKNHDSLKAELLTRSWTVDKICRSFRIYKRSGYQKPHYVRHALDSIAKCFIPEGTFNNMGMEECRMSGHQLVAKRGYIDQWTEQTLLDLAEAYKQRQADRQAEIEAQQARLDNPQTIEDYVELRNVRGLDADQQATLERMVAERTRSSRISQKASRLEIGTNALEGRQWIIQESIHTKNQTKIWIAKLDEKVDKEVYQKLKTRAQAHNGYYSRFSKGFLFESKAEAQAFITIEDNNGEETAEHFAQRRQLNAIHHLQNLAESIRSGAEDWINQDRLVNTARRARIYESCLSDRHYQVQIAETLETICDQLAQAKLEWLDRIRFGSEVHQLYALMRSAQSARAQAEGVSHSEAIRQPFCKEDIDYVNFPYPTIHQIHLHHLYNGLSNKSGFTLAYNRLAKQFKHLRKDHLVFQNGGGNSWKALEKFVACPQWKRRDRQAQWAWEEIHDRMLPIKRLERMEIGTLYELKQACLEFLAVLAIRPELDPATRLELSLQGTNRKWNDFFPTKPHIAGEYLEGIDFSNKRVLEPQAGTGNLAAVIQDGNPDHLMCIEVATTQAEILRLKGYEVQQANFLDLTPEDIGTYDVIASNPPFGQNSREAQAHAEHSVQFLVPGGTLAIFSLKGVSLLGTGMTLCTHEVLEHGWAEGTEVSGVFQVWSKAAS